MTGKTAEWGDLPYASSLDENFSFKVQAVILSQYNSISE